MRQSPSLLAAADSFIRQTFMPTLALSIVLLATACAGTPPTANNVAAVDSTAVDAEEKECLLIKLTGTNIPKRRCYTKAQWEEISKTDRQVANEYSRQTRENSSVVQYEQNASPF